MSHTKIPYYEECMEHARPPVPDGPYDAEDPAWRASDDWDDSHFYVGEDGVLTCEERRIGDACAECSERRIERHDGEWEYWVPWHGSHSGRDGSGRFTAKRGEA